MRVVKIKIIHPSSQLSHHCYVNVVNMFHLIHLCVLTSRRWFTLNNVKWYYWWSRHHNWCLLRWLCSPEPVNFICDCDQRNANILNCMKCTFDTKQNKTALILFVVLGRKSFIDDTKLLFQNSFEIQACVQCLNIFSEVSSDLNLPIRHIQLQSLMSIIFE